MKNLLCPLAGAVLFVAASCADSGPEPVTIVGIAFGSDTATLVVNDTAAFVPVVADSRNATVANPAIEYSSSAPAVATVDAQGHVAAVAPGTTTITATVEDTLHDELAITVVLPTIKTVAFSRNLDSLYLDESKTTSISLIDVRNKTVVYPTVTYASSDASVATVHPDGRVHGITTGVATITATVDTAQGSFQVAIVPQFTQLVLGSVHTCGITGKAYLYCWGWDGQGQLGGGSATPLCSPQGIEHCSRVPFAVTQGDRFVSAVAGEFHTCALSKTGQVFCWGGNQYGQLGLGSTITSTSGPTLIAGGHTFKSLGAGRFHTCGITTSDETYCWGWDLDGELGIGGVAPDRCKFFSDNEPCSRTPLKVDGGHSFKTVLASEHQTCGHTTANQLYCWGLHLGADSTNCQQFQRGDCARTPMLQANGTTYPKIGMGGLMQCGQDTGGRIFCRGFGFSGQFGNGAEFTNAPDPISVAGGESFTEFAGGAAHMCGLQGQSARCWGDNEYGSVGDGGMPADRWTPTPVSGGIAFSTIASGRNTWSNCGISTAGRAYCWGDGRFGELGNNTMVSSAVPVLVKLVP